MIFGGSGRGNNGANNENRRGGNNGANNNKNGPEVTLTSLPWHNHVLVGLFTSVLVYAMNSPEIFELVVQCMTMALQGMAMMMSVLLIRLVLVRSFNVQPVHGLLYAALIVAVMSFSPVPKYVREHFFETSAFLISQLGIIIALTFNSIK
jgi:high-affinity Fe2+/Pb2+ permease